MVRNFLLVRNFNFDITRDQSSYTQIKDATNLKLCLVRKRSTQI